MPADVLPAYQLMKAFEIEGAARQALDMTVDYVKTRKQYGVPVGGFQAVQHSLSECLSAD